MRLITCFQQTNLNPVEPDDSSVNQDLVPFLATRSSSSSSSNLTSKNQRFNRKKYRDETRAIAEKDDNYEPQQVPQQSFQDANRIRIEGRPDSALKADKAAADLAGSPASFHQHPRPNIDVYFASVWSSILLLESNREILPIGITPWLWGGISVRIKAALQRCESRIVWCGIAIAVASIFPVPLMALFFLSSNSLHNNNNMSWLICWIWEVTCAIPLLVLIVPIIKYYEQEFLEEMNRIEQDLSPTIRAYSCLDMSFHSSIDSTPFQRHTSQLPNRGQPWWSTKQIRVFMMLVPLPVLVPTAKEEAGGQPTYNETTCSVHCQLHHLALLEVSPPLPNIWLASSPKADEEEAIPKTGPITISVFRPWSYVFHDYFFATSPNARFGPLALQGHAEVDVFTWGLLFIALEEALSKTKLPLPSLFWMTFFLAYGLSEPLLLCLSPAASSTQLLFLTIAFCSGVTLVLALLLEVVAAVWTAPRYHASCQQVVQDLAPIIYSKCGYDIEYQVTRGYLFGSTSELRLLPRIQKSMVA